jgi:hypothetical protein
MEQPIVEPGVLFLINLVNMGRIACFILCMVFLCLSFALLLVGEGYDDSILKMKKSFIAGIAFGILSVIIPPPVVIEKMVIAHYSTPEIMERFDSYEDFYNQLGYEIRGVDSELFKKIKKVENGQ